MSKEKKLMANTIHGIMDTLCIEDYFNCSKEECRRFEVSVRSVLEGVLKKNKEPLTKEEQKELVSRTVKKIFKEYNDKIYKCYYYPAFKSNVKPYIKSFVKQSLPKEKTSKKADKEQEMERF